MSESVFSLGARLEMCAEFVRQGKVLADIGTDHAYLPIWLALKGKIPRAYASDINEEPIKSAIANIEKYHLSDKIFTFTADGLAKIPYADIDDIVIAGMGGDNIAGILNAADWLPNPRYRLILQPMSRAERLREYLYHHHFEIIAEKPVCEANRLYTVICAEYREYSENPPHFDEFEVYVGKLGNENAYAVKLIQKQAGILQATADGLAAKGDDEGAAHFRALSEKLLSYAKGEDV